MHACTLLSWLTCIHGGLTAKYAYSCMYEESPFQFWAHILVSWVMSLCLCNMRSVRNVNTVFACYLGVSCCDWQVSPVSTNHTLLLWTMFGSSALLYAKTALLWHFTALLCAVHRSILYREGNMIATLSGYRWPDWVCPTVLIVASVTV